MIKLTTQHDILHKTQNCTFQSHSAGNFSTDLRSTIYDGIIRRLYTKTSSLSAVISGVAMHLSCLHNWNETETKQFSVSSNVIVPPPAAGLARKQLIATVIGWNS